MVSPRDLNRPLRLALMTMRRLCPASRIGYLVKERCQSADEFRLCPGNFCDNVFCSQDYMAIKSFDVCIILPAAFRNVIGALDSDETHENSEGCLSLKAIHDR